MDHHGSCFVPVFVPSSKGSRTLTAPKFTINEWLADSEFAVEATFLVGVESGEYRKGEGDIPYRTMERNSCLH